METIKLLETLCQSYGVAGEESSAVASAAKICQDLGEITYTPHGSLICQVSKPKPGGAHIVLDGHIDEIGLIITSVESNGFLRFNRCGGSDRRLIMASPVVIHTADGEEIPGVIGSTPPHLQTGEQKNLTFDQAYIDAGLTEEQANEKNLIGCRASFVGDFHQLQGGLVTSKALDDRCGCAAVIMAAELIKKSGCNAGVTILLSSMEETGGTGAATASYTIHPTHAIAVDVTFAKSPGLEKYHLGDLKKGPMIGKGPMLDNSMFTGLVACAKKENIPYQIEVLNGHTGTNADNMALARDGVRISTVSIPQRYMHSPIEVISVEDVENTARLLAAYATSL